MARYDTILHVFSCVYMVAVVVGGVPASSTLDSKAINSVILYLRSFFKTYRPPTCWLLYWYRSGQSVEPLVHLGQKRLIGIYAVGGDGGGRHKQRLNETESCRCKGIREQEAQCQFIRYSINAEYLKHVSTVSRHKYIHKNNQASFKTPINNPCSGLHRHVVYWKCQMSMTEHGK